VTSGPNSAAASHILAGQSQNKRCI